MGIYTNEKYRVKRSAEFEDQMKYLRDLGIFSDYASVLTVSAVIGYNNNLFVPVTKTASDAVQIQFFNPRCKDIMDLIAYAHEKKQSILSSDGKYSRFEAYANRGFPVLSEKLEFDFDEPSKNDRLKILENYFRLLLLNGLFVDNGTNN